LLIPARKTFFAKSLNLKTDNLSIEEMKMILRQIFATMGKPTSGRIVRVVRGIDGQLIPFSLWQKQEEARIAAVEAAKRMPQSQKEPYDYSQRAPRSQHAEFDFTQ
jgi:hypothetical protein